MLWIATTCPIAYPLAVPPGCAFRVCAGVDPTLPSTLKHPSVAPRCAPCPGHACILGKTSHPLPALVLCPMGDPPLTVSHTFLLHSLLHPCLQDRARAVYGSSSLVHSYLGLNSSLCSLPRPLRREPMVFSAFASYAPHPAIARPS